MGKKELTAQCLIPVRLIYLAGANVDGKPNFIEIASGGILSYGPPMFAVPIRHHHHTLKGILENWTFSVNVPSVELAKEADYCGTVSGANTDKVRDCDFKISYGKLETAPMIDQFPITMECSVIQILRTDVHSVVIGRVDGTYISEELLKEGKPDFDSLAPLLYFAQRGEYFTAGQSVGKARSIGNELKKS
ncbi:MAG: flavin reductase family protein [Chloroflexi bacterium]|nr:flavin reductase family protein [Chloroflexota bacterium]